MSKPRYAPKTVVCAFGPHINRLREALEARVQVPHAEPEEEVEAVAAD